MISKRIFAFAGALLLSAAALSAQNIAKDQKIVKTGPKLPPRSNIQPYSSRDAAVLQPSDSTDYIIPLKDWEVRSTAEGTRYTSRFKIPYTWHDRVVIFRNTGASSSFSVEFNGVEAGYSQLSAGRVEFDLTKLANEDYNTISIIVHNDAAARKIEAGRSDKTFVGDARIVVQPKVYVKDFDISTSFDNAGRGHLAIGVIMHSTLLNPKEYKVHYELISPSGEVIDKAQRSFTANAKNDEVVRFSTIVENVKHWNHETPYLYTVVVKTQHEGRFKEYVSQRIGFRDAEYRDGKIFIDGKSPTLYARPHAFAVSDDIARMRADLENLKKEGVNCIMVQNAPQSDIFYTLCDEIGIYVIDQAAIDASKQSASPERGGTPSNDPTWLDSYVERAEQMYYSSRLHPSVIGFSISRNSSNGYCLQESYVTLKNTGERRPFIYPEAGNEWNNDPVANINAGGYGHADIVRLENIAPGVVAVANTSEFTHIEGTMTYGILKGNKIKKGASVPVSIAPGQQMTVSIPLKTGKSSDVGVKIETAHGSYRFVPAADGSQQSAANNSSGAVTVIFEGSVRVNN